ncbi:MAG: transcriptional regulator [Spirochaetales bacterium]|nr:transcriptional regulator [Spirochaetales bacterium]
MKDMVHIQASDDFDRAKNKTRFDNIFSIIDSEKKALLSYYDVKKLTKPGSERYLGMRVVEIDQIIGSEGRYKDFSKAFLPKKEHLRQRWERVDRAHLQDVILPPISLFKIGDVYFVRDGNHRVSVAKMQGSYSIDAEVVELTTEITIEPHMTKSDLIKEVIRYEREQMLKESDLHKMLKMENICFTSLGRYDELLRHILGHKYFINQGLDEEISMQEAAISWFVKVYSPIVEIIRNENMLSRFPGRTEADIYIWTIKHWDGLKWKYGQDYPLDEAVKEYNQMYGRNLWAQIKDFFSAIRKKYLSLKK